MGWKSTIDISRAEAIDAIREDFFKLDKKTNNELAVILMALGFGDDTEKKWYGHNFCVLNDDKKINENS